MHDRAWITKACDIVSWFRKRREIKLNYFKINDQVMISIEGLEEPDFLPPFTLRVHLDPDNVRHINCSYIAGDHYIDVKCEKNDSITIIL